MYTQFFGNYLLSHNYVTKDQLFSAMQKLSQEHMRLGTLAIHEGILTADEVDALLIMQTHQDKKFGELAIENNYLTEEQVVQLLKAQSPDFLLLGQILVDDGVIDNHGLENIIADYRSENELYELDMYEDSKENLSRLFDHFYAFSEQQMPYYAKMYLELLFNNLIRFVGEDFTAIEIQQNTEFPVRHAYSQSVLGNYRTTSYMDMEEATAIEFASRYAGDHFTEFDEYVQASMEDFLNLHNGLFIVNASNESSLELTLTPPAAVQEPLLTFDKPVFFFPVMYSFGTLYFIIQFDDLT